MNDQEFEALIKVNEFAAKNNFNESFSSTLNQMTEVHTLSATEAHSMLPTHKEIITLRV